MHASLRGFCIYMKFAGFEAPSFARSRNKMCHNCYLVFFYIEKYFLFFFFVASGIRTLDRKITLKLKRFFYIHADMCFTAKKCICSLCIDIYIYIYFFFFSLCIYLQKKLVITFADVQKKTRRFIFC